MQRYASQAENSYYKAWRELKAARQIQNEADYVAGIGKAQEAVVQRMMHSPAPNHPPPGAEPASYWSRSVKNVKDASER